MNYRTLIEVADTFVGERILLRAYRTDDAEALFKAINDSRDHMYPYYTTFHQKHYDIAETRDLLIRWQARWALRDGFLFGIFLKESGHFLGSLGCGVRNWESRFFDLNYWLRQSAEGHGYMTEAVHLLTAYLFTHLLRSHRVVVQFRKVLHRSSRRISCGKP